LFLLLSGYLKTTSVVFTLALHLALSHYPPQAGLRRPVIEN